MSHLEEPSNDQNGNDIETMPAIGSGRSDSSSVPSVKYLQVRTIASFESLLSSRRRNHQQRDPSDSLLKNRLRFRQKIFSRNNQLNAQGGIVRVLIPERGFDSERQLSDCLTQASCADFFQHPRWRNWDHGDEIDFNSWDSIDEYRGDLRHFNSTSNFAGMFRERDRVFIPLSIIRSNPSDFTSDVLCLWKPPPILQQKHVTTSQMNVFTSLFEILGFVAVILASWWTYNAAQIVDWEIVFDSGLQQFERLLLVVLNTPFWLFDSVIEFPLRELYRHGPSLVGWEGESLPRICARVTYHGDEEFWSRNMEECERIFATKEAAAMQIRKPILIGFFTTIIFFMMKSFLGARAHRRQELDPDMVETFRAINMLARQLRRAINSR